MAGRLRHASASVLMGNMQPSYTSCTMSITIISFSGKQSNRQEYDMQASVLSLQMQGLLDHGNKTCKLSIIVSRLQQKFLEFQFKFRIGRNLKFWSGTNSSDEHYQIHDADQIRMQYRSGCSTDPIRIRPDPNHKFDPYLWVCLNWFFLGYSRLNLITDATLDSTPSKTPVKHCGSLKFVVQYRMRMSFAIFYLHGQLLCKGQATLQCSMMLLQLCILIHFHHNGGAKSFTLTPFKYVYVSHVWTYAWLWK